MSNRTKAEHLQWAKERALVYLPSNPPQALSSFMNDLSDHPDTKKETMPQAMKIMRKLNWDSEEQVRQFIERW